MNKKVSSILIRATALTVLASPLCLPVGQSQEVYSQIVGAIAVDVPASSDMVVAFPFKRSASFRGTIASFTDNVANLGSDLLTAGEFDAMGGEPTYFLYFENEGVSTGTLGGHRFDILSNTASAITVDTASLAGVTAGDSLSIREHWTLGEAFPQGIGFVEESEAGIRDVELIVPAQATPGGGIAVDELFFFYDGAWREHGRPLTESANGTTLDPSRPFVIRNNTAGTLRSYFFGEVVDTPLAIPLVSSNGDQVDNFVSLERPLGLTLNDLGLHNSGVFGTNDRLFVYPTGAGQDKTPVEYQYTGSQWQVAGTTTDAGSTELGAGVGLQIRKADAGADATDYWVNEWSLPQ